MSNVSVDIQRLQIALHGVSAEIAQAASVGLAEELQRRLGGRFGAQRSLLEIDQLSIGPINTPQVLNAAGLRGLIAERLLDALGARLARDDAPAGGG